MAWWTDQTESWDSTIYSEDIRKPLNIFEQMNVTIRFAYYPNREIYKEDFTKHDDWLEVEKWGRQKKV